MNVTVVAGPTYGLNENSELGAADRYIAVVRVVCNEATSTQIITTNVKQYQADVVGTGPTLPRAQEALQKALQAVVDTNDPERAVKLLADRMAQRAVSEQEPS